MSTATVPPYSVLNHRILEIKVSDRSAAHDGTGGWYSFLKSLLEQVTAQNSQRKPPVGELRLGQAVARLRGLTHACHIVRMSQTQIDAALSDPLNPSPGFARGEEITARRRDLAVTL